jgi:hypothetical protein
VSTTSASGTAARRARREAQRSEPAAQPVVPSADEQPPAAAPVPSPRLLDSHDRAALEEERDFLLQSLEDLEREYNAGDVDPVDYEALKDDYTARAAATLRALERGQTAAAATTARTGGRARRPRSHTIALVMAVAVVAVGLGVFVARSSGTRDPGATVSGDIRQAIRDQLLDAQQLYAQGRLLDSIKQYDAVLRQQPANPEALTYKGWLLYLTSTSAKNDDDRQVLVTRAFDLLNQAVTAQSDYPDAHIFRAVIFNRMARPADALDDLAKLEPGDIPADMVGVVDGLRADVQAQVAGPTTVAPAPPSTPVPPVDQPGG